MNNQREAMACVDYILESEWEDFYEQVIDGNEQGVNNHVYKSAYIAAHGIGAYQLKLKELKQKAGEL